MVLISLKSTMGADSSNDGFLFETKSTTTVDDLIQSLVEIHNARQRSFLIIHSVKELAIYGPMKNPEPIGTKKVRFHQLIPLGTYDLKVIVHRLNFVRHRIKNFLTMGSKGGLHTLPIHQVGDWAIHQIHKWQTY